MSFFMTILKFITAPVVIIGAYIVYSSYKKDKSGDKYDETLSNAKVLFFNGSNAVCRKNCLIRKISCGSNCSLTKLKYIVGLINEAKKTLDVCVYLITCNDLTFAIIRAHKRGVLVRIIVDEEMTSSTESKISLFIDAGIIVKSKRSNVLMHHKFCVIDKGTSNQKLLTGSMNWTLQGLAGNYEYVTITSHPIPVKEYQREFDLLWSTFDIKK